MRSHSLLLAIPLVLSLAGPIKADNPPANPMDQIAWLIGGKWTAEGDKGPDGKPFHVETRFEWSANHQGLKFTTWFLVNGKLAPEYDGLYTWDPADKKFHFLYSNSEGEMTEGKAAWDNDSLEQEFQIVQTDGTVGAFRSTVKRMGPDNYDWNVRNQSKDGNWVVLFGLKYKRQWKN